MKIASRLPSWWSSWAACSPPPQAPAATLVEKGQARAVIIVPEKPSPVVENAARVLRDHIKQMSGAELPIRTEDQVTGSPRPTRPGSWSARASWPGSWA